MPKKISVDEKYKGRTLHESILRAPDSYIGSIEDATHRMWIYNEKAKKGDPLFIFKEITYNPGLYKITDEILVNARDHQIRDKECNKIKVDVSQEESQISVFNNGKGIEVEMHKKENMLVPTLIFSKLLTSSNYNENERRIVGGKNGFGAKLTNIWSQKFEVETLDADQDKKFYQKFEENMYKIHQPKITSGKGKASYTRVSFIPDLKKFGLKKIDDDMVALLKKRTYDIAMNSGSNVSFNGEKITTNSFQKYVDAYFPNEEDVTKVYDMSNKRWKICVVYDPSGKLYNQATDLRAGIFHISFVNSICTSVGGTHVEYVTSQIINALKNIAVDKIKTKGVKVTPNIIKENLIFFIDATIENPGFNSQTKVELTTKKDKFGSTYEVTDKFIKKLAKTGIIEQIVANATAKAEVSVGKVAGGVKGRFLHPKFYPAKYMGPKAKLILTEGDSALKLVLAGTNVIGRDYYSIFPLRGKMLNTRKGNFDQLQKNEEIIAVMKMLGIEKGKKYTDVKKLKHGGIIIMTDQDVDGSHIKGLLIGFMEDYWPDLLKIDGFIQCLPTPIVKVFKGKGTNQKKMSFYSLQEFEKWKKENNDGKGWNLKYYKGLGTSTREDAPEYFEDIEDKLINYVWQEKYKKTEKIEQDYEPKFKDVSKDAISLAFDKERAADRKLWIARHDPKAYIDNAQKNVTYPEFIHKELNAFAVYNVARAVPHIMDGFKPSQRKIYYAAELKNIYDKEIKIAQFSGFISEKTAYHHGEDSLNQAIIAMAHDFVGSNNINLLRPNGQFGSRVSGGDDNAAPRYIFTQLNEMAKIIFNPDDYPILNKQFDDGDEIEPEFYAPIIPMILVNGAKGIATGYATDIYPTNPRDIHANILKILNDEKPKTIAPWFRNFTGTIEKVQKDKYVCRANFTIDGDKIHISDLPIGVWTENYKQFLINLKEESEKKKKEIKKAKKEEDSETEPKGKGKGKGTKRGGKKQDKLKAKARKSNTAKVAKTNPLAAYFADFEEACTDTKVDFTITFKKGSLKTLVKSGKLEQYLKLAVPINLSNMHLFDTNGRVKKYESYNDILREYVVKRLELYQKRKDYLLEKWRHEMDILEWKIKFIRYYHAGKIVIVKNNRPVSKDKLIEQLETYKFPQFAVGGEVNPSYNYLIHIRVIELTLEEIEKLQAQFDNKEAEFKDLEGKTPKKKLVCHEKRLQRNHVKFLRKKMQKSRYRCLIY
jgi:DNA topoisomerase-2